MLFSHAHGLNSSFFVHVLKGTRVQIETSISGHVVPRSLNATAIRVHQGICLHHYNRFRSYLANIAITFSLALASLVLLLRRGKNPVPFRLVDYSRHHCQKSPVSEIIKTTAGILVSQFLDGDNFGLKKKPLGHAYSSVCSPTTKAFLEPRARLLFPPTNNSN